MSQVLKPKKGYKSVPWLFGKEIEIPEEWEVKKLNEITNKIGDGIHSTPEYVEHSEYYFINGNNLINGKITYFENTKNVSKEEFLKYELKLNENTILLSINGTIGNVAFYNKEKIILGKSASYIICNDKLNTLFLFYQLQSNLTKKYFSTQLTGTTISNLSLSSIRNMIFHLPLFPEQQKIASILSNINNLIESTRQVIKNSKSLKTGLVQKLLTRGIGHTKFKKLIVIPRFIDFTYPEDWEIFTLEKLSSEIKDGPMGFGLHTSDYVGKGIPILRIQNLKKLTVTKNDLRFISQEKHIELKKSQVKPLDIIISKTGILGMLGIVPENYGPANLNQALARITLKDKESVFYIASFLASKIPQQILNVVGSGRTVQAGLKLSDIKNLKIPLPPLPEQQQIASILSNIDAQINSQTQYKEKLERLKKSLMQKLLTGAVRV